MQSPNRWSGNREAIFDFLESLRSALLRLGAVVCIAAVAGYYAAEKILRHLVTLTGVHLVAYDLPETFFSFITIALGTGLLVGMPYFFYTLLASIPKHTNALSRRQAFGFWLASIFLFYVGMIFCLEVTLPYGIQFLLSFETEKMQALISVRSFVYFCLLFLFAFGFIFELPLAMMVLGRIELLQVSRLAAHRRYAVLVISIISAVLTPTPDAFNMALMAVPLYLLYELGILGMRLWPPAARPAPMEKAKT